MPAAEGATPLLRAGAAEAAAGAEAAPANASCTPLFEVAESAPSLRYSPKDFGGFELPRVPPRNDSTFILPTTAAFGAFFAGLPPGSLAAIASNPQAVLAILAYNTGAGQLFFTQWLVLCSRCSLPTS